MTEVDSGAQLTYSVVIAVAAFAVLTLVQRRRHDFVVQFDGQRGFLAAAGFVLITNAATLLLPGRSSIPLAAAVVLLLIDKLTRLNFESRLGGNQWSLQLAWLVHGALLAGCFLFDLLRIPGVYNDRYFTYLGAALLWVLFGAFCATSRVTLRGMAYLGLLLLGLMAIASPLVPSFWRPCTGGDLDKCSVAGALFTSFASSENYVAILASVTLVCCLASLRGRDRVLSVSFCLLLILVTGSRTGFLAVSGESLCCVIGMRKAAHGPSRGDIFRAGVFASSCVALSLFLLSTATPETFSRRGSIWIAVRENLQGYFLTGVGLSKWDFLRTIGGSSQHFFHSGYLLLVFSGGLLGLALLALWIFLVMRSQVSLAPWYVVKAPLVVVAIYSFAEVVWNPLAVDGFTWIILFIFSADTLSRGGVESLNASGETRVNKGGESLRTYVAK